MHDWNAFNIDLVAFDATIGLFGMRGSGKTTALMNLLMRKKLARGIAMCPTPECFQTYGVYIPMSYCYNYFDESVLENIMTFQDGIAYKIQSQFLAEVAVMQRKHEINTATKWEKRMAKFKRAAEKYQWNEDKIDNCYVRITHEAQDEEKQDKEAMMNQAEARRQELRRSFAMFVVLDDLASDQKALKSTVVRTLINNGRHYMMMLFVAVQYSMTFPKGCRGGLDWVVLFNDSSLPNLEVLFKNYVSCFRDINVFRMALADAAENKGCIVIRKSKQDPIPENNVFLFEPERLFIPKELLGDETFKWVHEMYYDQHLFEQSHGMHGGSAFSGKEKKRATSRKKGKRSDDEEDASGMEKVLIKKMKLKNKRLKEKEKHNKPKEEEEEEEMDPDTLRQTKKQKLKEKRFKQQLQELKKLREQVVAQTPPPSSPLSPLLSPLLVDENHAKSAVG